MTPTTPGEAALLDEIQRLQARITELEHGLTEQLPPERYSMLFEAAREGFAHYRGIYDESGALADLLVLEINRAGAEMCGVSAARQIGRTWREIWPGVDNALFLKYQQVDRTGERLQFDDFNQSTGRTYDVTISKMAPGEFLATFNDITERKRAEQVLRESEEHFRTLSETMLQGVVYQAADGTILSMNPAAERILGRTPADFLGVTSSDLEPVCIREDGSTFPGQEHPSMVALATGQEVRNARMGFFNPRERKYRWIEITAVPLIRKNESKPYQVYTVFEDITERKLAEEALQESAKILHTFFESPGVMRGIIETTPDAVVHVSCNTDAAELFGVDAASIVGKAATEVGASEEVNREWLRRCRESRETGHYASWEYARKDFKGRERWLLATVAYLGSGPSGRPRFAYSITDLTERKRSEEALRQSEEQFRLLTQNLNSAVALVDSNGAFSIVNNSFLQIFDIPEGTDILNVNSRDWADWQVFDENGQLLAVDEHPVRQAALTRRAVRNRLVEVKTPSGTNSKWLLVSVEPMLDSQGNLQRLICTFYDITDRRAAEEALRESEARFRLALKNSPVSVAAQDRDLRFIWAYNQRSVKTHQIIGRFDRDIFTPAEAEHLTALKRRVLEDGVEQHERLWLERPAGRMYLDVWFEPIRDQAGRITGVASATVDLTPIKLAEEEVRRSHALLEAFFDASPGNLNIVDEDFRYVKTDRLTPTYYGLTRDSIVGRNLAEIGPEFLREFGPVMREVMETGQAKTNIEVHAPVPGRGGDTAYWLVSYFPVPLSEGRRGVGIVGVEITELRKNEERLRETQKLESIGLLAGGIAHDFNNLLTGVMGNASLLLEDAQPEQAEVLRAILSSTERASHLTRQLLAYSGKGQFVVRDLDITQNLNEIADLIQFSIPKSVELRLNLQRRVPTVSMDPGQLQQVLMNLVINAGEAIGDGQPGAIAVATSVSDFEQTFRDDIGAELAPGRYVVIDVADTGAGIAPEKKAKIFDPFFTTKFVGRGLGLAAVAGILRTQKGGIVVESTPGHGSNFRVFLPASTAAVSTVQSETVRSPIATILVVDDESAIRRFIGSILQRKGYRVLQAADGKEALNVCAAEPGAIAVAVVDIIMPNMAANDLLPALAASRPGMRILLTSGYSEGEARRLCAAYPAASFIQKPYTAQQLAKAVEGLLPVSA